MGILPTKSKIVKYWNDYLFKLSTEELEVFPDNIWIDIGEPDCWACGRYDPNFNDIWEFCRKCELSEDEHQRDDKLIWRMWNNASLERHHIIPKSLGGSDEPSNLFLLCAECHKDAPHIADFDLFIIWAKNRRTELNDKFFDCIKPVMNFYKLDISDEDDANFVMYVTKIMVTNKHPLYDEMNKYIIRKLSYHFNGNIYSRFRDSLSLAIQYALKSGWTAKYLKEHYHSWLESLLEETRSK